MKAVMGNGVAVRVILALIIVGVMAVSGYAILKINNDYEQESVMHKQMLGYKPTGPQLAEGNAPVVNQSIIDLQGINGDVVGWITIPNMNVDYPFVQSSDNDYYLRKDINKNYALAGTVFMDYRCKKDFSDFNTIIYGHHMKNGTMFGDIEKFGDKDFFEVNKTGTIFLSNKTYTIEMFAYIVLEPNDELIYTVSKSSNYLEHVKSIARNYRDIGVADGDRIVTLSSCNYEFNNARMVLIGRLKEAEPKGSSEETTVQ